MTRHAITVLATAIVVGCCHSAMAVDLNGLWVHEGTLVRITHNVKTGSISGRYIKRRICRHRDGTDKTSSTSGCFRGTLKARTITGEYGECYWGNDNSKVGIVAIRMSLTVSEKGSLLSGESTGTIVSKADGDSRRVTGTLRFARKGTCDLVKEKWKTAVNKYNLAKSALSELNDQLKQLDAAAAKQKKVVDDWVAKMKAEHTAKGSNTRRARSEAGTAIERTTSISGKPRSCRSSFAIRPSPPQKKLRRKPNFSSGATTLMSS